MGNFNTNMTVQELIEELQYEVNMGRSDFNVLISDSENKKTYNIDEIYCESIGTIHIEFNQKEDYA